MSAALTERLRRFPFRVTLAEYLALPESNDRGCPNCGGLHYGATNCGQGEAPGVYRCHGTEWPNAEGAPFQPPCGALFRGRAGEHFDADYFAPFFDTGDSQESPPESGPAGVSVAETDKP